MSNLASYNLQRANLRNHVSFGDMIKQGHSSYIASLKTDEKGEQQEWLSSPPNRFCFWPPLFGCNDDSCTLEQSDTTHSLPWPNFKHLLIGVVGFVLLSFSKIFWINLLPSVTLLEAQFGTQLLGIVLWSVIGGKYQNRVFPNPLPPTRSFQFGFKFHYQHI